MPLTPTTKIWMDGELIDWDKATVHVLTHSLHYGMGVFEGIRAYATANGPAIFRLRDHTKRLLRGTRILQMDLPYSEDEVFEAIKLTVARERARQLLHPAARLSRLWRDGHEPDLVQGEPCHRGVALGRLPRRRGP